jgi:hypothetical protein
MLLGQVIRLSPYWLAVTIICVAIALLIYLRFGFPFRHRNLPPVESVILAILGTFLAASGVKVVYSLFTLQTPEDLIIPLVAAAIILLHMGVKDVVKAFRSAEYKPITPPAKDEVDTR